MLYSCELRDWRLTVDLMNPLYHGDPGLGSRWSLWMFTVALRRTGTRNPAVALTFKPPDEDIQKRLPSSYPTACMHENPLRCDGMSPYTYRI